MILQFAQVILVEVQCRCVIVQEDDSVLNRSGKWLREWYWKHHPIKPTIDRLKLTDQATKSQVWLDCNKASNSSEYLRAVGLQQTLPRNDWPNTRMSASTARSLEPVWVLDQEQKLWNRAGACSQPQSLMFRKLMWEDKEQTNSW